MQITEILSDGLKRGFKIVIPANDLAAKVDAELEELKGKVKINGFRPGKAPASFLRKMYGRSVMADIIQSSVNEANRTITEDRGIKLALEPKVSFPEAEGEIAAVMEGKADLSFEVAVEILPAIVVADHSAVKLVRDVAVVDDTTLNDAIDKMAAQNRTFTEKPADATAATGDRLTVDFVGSIDGAPFEGGKGEDITLELGSGTFIPGFEEGLIGATAGETRTVQATFPTAYARQDLAGKAASFVVVVKTVASADAIVIDDTLAKGFGMDSLDQLKEAVKTSIERDFAQQSRQKIKRKLLDALDATYTFDLPPSLVEQEFSNVWSQVEGDMKSEGRSFTEGDGAEADVRAEYRRIAERRVRLGLVLAEIGAKADIKVSDEEVSQALVAKARQYPGQEKDVWEYYRKNQQAFAELRAPIYEEKVVDVVLSQVQIEDRIVAKEVLFADDEAPETAA